MARYVYRQRGGKVVAELVSERTPPRGTPDFLHRGFHDNVLAAYRQAEEKGIRPQVGGPSWNTAKRVHESARERE